MKEQTEKGVKDYRHSKKETLRRLKTALNHIYLECERMESPEFLVTAHIACSNNSKPCLVTYSAITNTPQDILHAAHEIGDNLNNKLVEYRVVNKLDEHGNKVIEKINTVN